MHGPVAQAGCGVRAVRELHGGVTEQSELQYVSVVEQRATEVPRHKSGAQSRVGCEPDRLQVQVPPTHLSRLLAR